MLVELSIKNFALIEELRLQFKQGFTVISGETGTGKSILVEALGLLLGERADLDLIRAGSGEAMIEAIFDISHNNKIQTRLVDEGLEEGNELILRRILSAEGRSRIYANGRTITLVQLEELTRPLVDLSGQHESQLLLKTNHHASLLDQDPSIQKLLCPYKTTFDDFKKMDHEIAELKQKSQKKEEEIDFLRFQLKEIEAGRFDNDEEEEQLLEEKARAKNAGFFYELTSQAETCLTERETSVVCQLGGLLQKLKKGYDLDPSLKEGFELVDQARRHAEEASFFLSKYKNRIDVEPGRLEEIEARLYLIHKLKKKFGGSIGEIKKKRDEMAQRLDQLENVDDRLSDLQKEWEALSRKLLDQALAVSLERNKKARILEKGVARELADLAMDKAGFRVVVERAKNRDTRQCTPTGFDQVFFEIAPNTGEGFRSLAKIASGGELSRILLAIKQVLRSDEDSITYFFDEVDAGIGGATADVVGKKLKQLAHAGQVICVTHLPQVASHADHHYVIEKGETNKRTRTTARQVEGNDRENELARMLGGAVVSAKAREHAREMLKISQK